MMACTYHMARFALVHILNQSPIRCQYIISSQRHLRGQHLVLLFQNGNIEQGDSLLERERHIYTFTTVCILSVSLPVLITEYK